MFTLVLLVAMATLVGVSRSAPTEVDDVAAAAASDEELDNDNAVADSEAVDENNEEEDTDDAAENESDVLSEYDNIPSLTKFQSTSPPPSETPPDNGHKLPCTEDEKRVARCGVHGDCFVLSIVARTTACVCYDGWTDNRCLTKSMVMYGASFNVFITLAVVGAFCIIVLIIVIVWLALKTKTCQRWREERSYNKTSQVEQPLDPQRK